MLAGKRFLDYEPRIVSPAERFAIALRGEFHAHDEETLAEYARIEIQRQHRIAVYSELLGEHFL